MYYDDLLDWRKGFVNEELEKLELECPVEIVIHMLESATLDLKLDATKDELKCKFEIVKEKTPCFSVFELPPPVFPFRIVVVTFELTSPEGAHMIFSGNLYPFRPNFMKRHIKGKRVKLKPNDAYAEFYRVIENIDLTPVEECVRRLTDIFDDCLAGSPVVVRVKDSPHPRNLLGEVIKPFKELHHIRVEF